MFGSCSNDKSEVESNTDTIWATLVETEYSNVDEFASMLINNQTLWCKNEQALKVLSENAKVSVFFDRGTSALQLAQQLYDSGLNTADIYSLYQSCCREEWWYNNIVVIDTDRTSDEPVLGTTPIDRTYFPLFLYNLKPNKQQVYDGVKSMFINPDSLVITSDINFYYNVDDAKQAYTEPGNDIKLLVSFSARSKNNLGAYSVNNFSVEYDYPYEFSRLQQNENIETSIWRFSGTYTIYDNIN